MYEHATPYSRAITHVVGISIDSRTGGTVRKEEPYKGREIMRSDVLRKYDGHITLLVHKLVTSAVDDYTCTILSWILVNKA